MAYLNPCITWPGVPVHLLSLKGMWAVPFSVLAQRVTKALSEYVSTQFFLDFIAPCLAIYHSCLSTQSDKRLFANR